MTQYMFSLVACALLASSDLSHAKVISIADQSNQVENSSQGVLRPTQGMSMAFVEQQFGQALQKYDAIGDPPISRWIYTDFEVFFEYKLVIHSVVPHK